MSPVRIVILEDDAVDRMALKGMLQNLGYKVVGEAEDPDSAISMARELRPDIMVMDISMEGADKDGIDAANAVRDQKIAPVVLITGRHQKDYLDRAIEAGVFNYVMKPFSQEQLKPAIEIALARYQAYDQMERDLVEAKDRLQSRILVEKAKGILMQVRGMPEAEAYAWMRKRAMDTRKNIREIAESLILAHPEAEHP